MNPFEIFNNWYTAEKHITPEKIPSACCLTTIGLDNYPNSRFVSLKEIKNDSFVITGPLNSRKGKEIFAQPKVSLTFWWWNTQKQVRIQGDAFEILPSEATAYFDNRHREAKIVSTTFDQGKEIQSFEALLQRFETKKEALGKKHVTRPKEWGGFYIQPIRIEFMEFESSRLHKRELYQKLAEKWTKKIIQP